LSRGGAGRIVGPHLVIFLFVLMLGLLATCVLL
jgi:hypothetical protein